MYTWCVLCIKAIILCQVSIFSFCILFQKCQQIIIIYRHQKISNLYHTHNFVLISVTAWRNYSMVSIYLCMAFAHVEANWGRLMPLLPFPFSFIYIYYFHFCSAPRKCAALSHSTTAIKHINTKHFIVWPAGNNHSLRLLSFSLFTHFYFI